MTALNFPASPSSGDVHNAANGLQYAFDGVKWTSQGTYDTGAINAQKLDSIASSFNGSTTTFNLKVNNNTIKPHNEQSLSIVLNGHLQEPVTAYTTSQTNGTITFATAPAAGTTFFGVLLSRLPVAGSILDGSVTNVKVASDAAIDGSKINPNFGSQNITTTGSITGTTTTQSSTDNTTKLASTAFVQTAIANLVDNSPATLNTLNELAAALNDDADFSTTITTALAAKAPINNPTFTGTVSGISYNDLNNKPTIPSNVSDLTNDSGFITATLTNEQVQDIVGGMVSNNTESGITVTYDDNDGSGGGYGKLNFSVSNTNTSNQRWNDGAKALFGTNDGLEIYHDASDSNSANHNSIISETGGGGLLVYASDIIFHKPGTSEKYAHFAQDGAANLYFDGGTYSTPKLATTASGVTVDGTVTATAFSGDGSALTGISAGSLPIASTTSLGGVRVGTNLTIDSTTGELSATQLSLTTSGINAAYGDSAQLILGAADGDGDDALKLFYGPITSGGTQYGVLTADNGLQLQHDGSSKLEILAAGTKWSGDLFADAFTNSGGGKIKMGPSGALQIYHDNNNSIIDDTGTGGLLLIASDIIFQKHVTSGTAPRMADFAQDGAVRLYENGTIRLTTTDAGVDVSGNIVVSGTVDGRDLQTDGTKLDGIAANANNYSLPIATNTALGGVKVGSNLTIDASTGVLSASQLSLTSSNISDVFTDGTQLILGDGTNSESLNLYFDGGSNNHGKITSKNAIHLQQDGSNKLEINSTGAKWIGDLFCDDGSSIKLGGQAALKIHHTVDGGNENSFIDARGDSNSNNGGLLFYAKDFIFHEQSNGSHRMADFAQDGGTGARLYYDNSPKIQTTNTGVTVSGAITVSGNVDGRDVSADGSKLDGIESGATADQTASEIRALVESASDSNVFTDADHTKLNNIGANANNYSLPIATNSVLGGIKVGSNLTIDSSTGVLSASQTTLTTSSISDVFGDNDNLILGTGSGNDTLKLYYNGTAGILTADNGVLLQYDGSTKFQTTNIGATVSGRLDTQGLFTGDNNKILIGNGDDLELFHDSTNSYIDNSEGALNVRLLTDNATSIQLIAGSDYMARFVKNGTAQLYWDNNLRLETASSGVKWFGDLFCDSDNTIKIGASAALQIYHDSTSNNSFITEGGSGSLVIKATNTYINAANDQAMIAAIAGGAVTLYHANSAKIATTSSGISVTGNIAVSGTVDGVDIAALNTTVSGLSSGGGATGFEFNDNVRIKFGASDDLQLFHDTNNSVIDGTGAGSLLLYASDIIFQEKSDGSHRMADFAQDGSTGVRLYYDNSVKLQTTSAGIATGNITVSTSQAEKIKLQGATNPYISFYEGTTFKAYLQWHGGDGYFIMRNDESGEYLRIGSGNFGLQFVVDGTARNVLHSGNVGSYALPIGGGTVTGSLNIGDGSGQSRLYLQKADNNVSDHIIFYNGTSRVAEIGVEDGSWLRINQETASNIYTPRMIRADGGFQVNGTTVINTSAQVPAARVSGTVSNATRAENLAGYSQNESASNNTIVRRNASGYIFGNYFNGSGTFSTSGNSSGMARFTGTNGSDTYGRSYTAAAARALLNVEDGATADQTASDINNLYPDNGNLILGTGTGSDTLKMYYNGSVGILTSNNGVILQFNGSTKIYTKSNGGRVNGAWFINNDTRYLSEPSGNYGSIQINGSGYNNWEGFSIDGRMVFMHSGGTDGGIYNDVNNEWMMYGIFNSYMSLYFNGSQKIKTENYGVKVAGTIRPHVTNGGDCGASDARWGTVYASNGSINTSDRNEKNSILEADLGLDFINKLKPVSYKWNDTRLGKKTHYGLIAQEVEEAIEKVGKDVDDIAMVQNPEFGPKGLYYNEIIGPLVKSVQELSAKVAALEAA